MYLSFGEKRPAAEMHWGVSFSRSQAEHLGLDWRAVYLSILDELHVDRLRVGSNWDEIEPQKDLYNYADLDFMVEQASLRHRNIVLTLGRRQPRWPECHMPGWTKSLSPEELAERQLHYVLQIVERYKKYQDIIAWQVENEFFLTSFGECPSPDEKFLQTEIEEVKALDSRPVILTDSGELSTWYKTAQYADIFGTTMYRRAYNPVWGVANWPHPPVYYSRLGKLVQYFTGFQKMIIAELQAEPWAKITLPADSTEENYKTFNPEQFQKNLEFARNSGIDEAYLWGAEWWYYMKEKRGIPDFWETAKTLWTKQQDQ